MKSITTYGTISGGKLLINNRNRFLNEISRLKDCTVELIVKAKNTRTTPQNKYLWGCVYKELQIAMNAYGNELSVEDIHEYCKIEFNKIPVVAAGGAAHSAADAAAYAAAAHATLKNARQQTADICRKYLTPIF